MGKNIFATVYSKLLTSYAGTKPNCLLASEMNGFGAGNEHIHHQGRARLAVEVNAFVAGDELV